jgi:hypothetical protein
MRFSSACLTLLGISLTASPAAGQWSAGLEVGADRYWGGSTETGTEHRSFRPYRPTTFGIRVERSGSRVGFGFQAHYAEAGLALEGDGAVATVEGVFTIVSLSPEMIYQLATLGPSNQLRLHAGPLFEVWTIIDEDSQTRFGFQGAVSLDIPLGSRFSGSIIAGAALTPSPFEVGQLGPGFAPRALWRRRFAAGVEYRL